MSELGSSDIYSAPAEVVQREDDQKSEEKAEGE